MRIWNVFLVLSIVVGGLSLWRLPRTVWRRGDAVDLVVLVDTSGSSEAQLPAYQTASCALVKELRPGDRLAVIAFDSNVHNIYTGTIGSQETLVVVQQQIHALVASADSGTSLRHALVQAGAAFDEFTGSAPSGLQRRRVLLLCSDGQDSPAAGTDEENWDEVRLPGLTTVLALGFQGVAQDRVAQVLLGPGSTEGEGTNDLHFLSLQEAEPAVAAAVDLIRDAHPLDWAHIGMVAIGLVAYFACILCLGMRSVIPRSPGMLPVKVRAFGSDDEQEAFLANGQRLTIGRRQEIPFNTTSVAVLSRDSNSLNVAPQSAADRVSILREGTEIRIAAPTTLRSGDLIQIDGQQFEASAGSFA